MGRRRSSYRSAKTAKYLAGGPSPRPLSPPIPFAAIAHAPHSPGVSSAFSIRLPSLGERKEAIGDISSLMISAANDRYGKEVVALDPGALLLLSGFPWDGNIDELREVVTELVVTSRSPYIGPTAVQEVLERRRYACSPSEISISGDRNLEEIEADIIRLVLSEEGGNQSKAAKRLGISRSTMWRKIRENGQDSTN